MQGAANGDGKILAWFQALGLSSVPSGEQVVSSYEQKGCGCSPMQVWMLNVPEEKQRRGSSLKLMQKLSDLHRVLESPPTGQILLCPVLLEV